MIGHAFSRPYQGGEELSPQHLLDWVADVRRGWCEGPVHIRRSSRGYLNRTERHPYLQVFSSYELGSKKLLQTVVKTVAGVAVTFEQGARNARDPCSEPNLNFSGVVHVFSAALLFDPIFRV